MIGCDTTTGGTKVLKANPSRVSTEGSWANADGSPNSRALAAYLLSITLQLNSLVDDIAYFKTTLAKLSSDMQAVKSAVNEVKADVGPKSHLGVSSATAIHRPGLR
jgi:hypothetical protein